MMSEKTTNGLQEAQERAKNAVKTIRDTRRRAVRSYLGAAFELRRATLHGLGVLNDEMETLSFTCLERAEKAEDRALKQVEERQRKKAQRWRERNERWRERAQHAEERFQQKRSKVEEARHRRDMGFRDGAKLGLSIIKVVGKRVDAMMGDFVQMGQREWQDMEGRIDGMLDKLENERQTPQTSAEIPPFPNYNTMSVEEVVAELAAFDAMQLRTVRGYEVRHQNRIEVLRAIDEMLAQRDEVED